MVRYIRVVDRWSQMTFPPVDLVQSKVPLAWVLPNQNAAAQRLPPDKARRALDSGKKPNDSRNQYQRPSSALTGSSRAAFFAGT